MTGFADGSAAVAEVARLVRHAEYLRQINSNKAFRAERRNRRLTIATVSVGAAITFVGFSGTTKLREQLQTPLGWSQQAIDLSYNFLVLLVLLLSIAALIYRLPERAAQYNRAIRDITAFIRTHESRVRLAGAGLVQASATDVEEAARAYIALVDGLPPSTDKQFLKAKKDYLKKRTNSKAAELGAGGQRPADAGGSSASESDVERVRRMIEKAPGAMQILRLLRDIEDHELWLTGGYLRSLVWDDIQGYPLPTFVEDVDVVYFSRESNQPDFDLQIEKRLEAMQPNVRWDVKNQARMRDPELPRPESVEDGLLGCPETASGVAARLDGDVVQVLAPLGLSDLLAMRVVSNPRGSRARFAERRNKKDWRTAWPGLDIGPEPHEGSR